jgi:hypothetical protein
MSSSKEEIIMSMGEVLVVFKNLEYKNQTLHESIIHLQTNQISIFGDTFLQHNRNQKSHGLAYLTSLITHIQNFEVLSTKCV